MAFSGLSFNEAFAASIVQQDVARAVAALAPKEVPVLNFLGDSSVFATSVKHEYVEDYMLPNVIVNSTAINSATAATSFQLNGLGLALTVGTILENRSAAPETLQVSAIIGANSITVTRNFDGAGIGSLAPGGSLYVREMAAVEGADHSGASTRRLGALQANTVGLLRIELSESDTQAAINLLSNDRFDAQAGKGMIDILHQLERAVLRGTLNGTNSLGTTTTTRTMKGIKGHIATVNSQIAAASFAANPHTYLGNVFEQVWNAGASSTEDWLIAAGSTFFRNISDLNTTTVQVSQEDPNFTRTVRRYNGPFGSAQVELSRVLSATELLLVPRERVRVVPLQGRSFQMVEMAKAGSNRKALIEGEYTVEVHHESGMARLFV